MQLDTDRAEPGWHVYVLRCADETLYTGVTRDLEARVEQHNAGQGAKYTRGRLPVRLVYAERAVDRSSAQRREYEIKRLPASAKRDLVRSGREKFQLRALACKTLDADHG